MNYTPHARLTNEELVQEICAKPDVTDLELEAMQRIEQLLEANQDLQERLGTRQKVNSTKYAEAT